MTLLYAGERCDYGSGVKTHFNGKHSQQLKTQQNQVRDSL